jgi:methanethiol S-methyltransferase
MLVVVSRLLALAYAAVAYLGFVVVTGWAVVFLANLPGPSTVDGGRPGPVFRSVAADAALLAVFAHQHSVMARTVIKRWLAGLQPASVERSTYVLATDIALALLFGLWQPIPASIWHVTTAPWVVLLWAGYALGWAVAVSATFMVDHLDFLGLRQAYHHGAGPYQAPPFTERLLYAWLRHPMMLGLILAFWVTPRMSVGHLLFAVAATGYIAVGVHLEERGLRRELGQTYEDYARRVPALVPLHHPRAARKVSP